MRPQLPKLVTGAILVSMVLAACSGGGTSSSDTAQTSAPTDSTVDAGGTTTTAGGETNEPATDSVLTFAVAGGGLTQLDPNKIASAALLPLSFLLYSALVQFDEDGTIQPDIAESWDVSSDQMTWTFNLRSDVTYHDGRAFTAADAVKNLERVLDPETGSQSRGRLTSIESVSAVDDSTLRIDLSTPNGLLTAALVNVKMSDVDSIATVNETGNGTGPYMLDDFVPDDHVTLVPNPNYFGTQGQIDRIEVVTVADTTAAVNSLRNGDLDVVWNVPPLDAATMADDPGLAVLVAKVGSGNVIWEIDTTSAPFNDVRARQALAYAIDRTELVAVGYDGRGVAAATNVVINPQQPAFDSSLPTYTKDLDKAKELFAEAGVTEGSTLTFWTIAGRNPQWVTMAQVLQQDLKKIGIELDIQQNEVSTWLERFYPAGKSYPATIVANYLSLPVEPSLQMNFFRSGICECNWSDSRFDDLHAQALAAESDDDRQAIYREMQGILNEQVPVVILMQTSQITVAQSRVSGLWVQSNGAVHLEGAAVTD